jgi:hypothetical protein
MSLTKEVIASDNIKEENDGLIVSYGMILYSHPFARKMRTRVTVFAR